MALVRKVGVTFAIVCTSGGYKSTDKAKTWMALEFIPVFTSTRQIAIPLHTLAR